MPEARNIDKKQFNNLTGLDDKIKFCLQYAVLAPSNHNTQPWLFKITGNSCQLYFDPKLRLPQGDPTDRNLYISLGKCLENLIIAAKFFGVYKDVIYKVGQEPNLAAEVLFQENTRQDLSLEDLVDAIPKRINIRGPFLDKKIEPLILDELNLIFNQYKTAETSLVFVTDREAIKKIAQLTEQGMHLAHGRKKFRQEMSGWINNSLTAKKDGMPGYSLRMPMLASFIIPTLMRYKDLGKLLGILNYKSVSTASAICFFNADQSSPEIWLQLGRAVERLTLEFQVRGITTSVYIASIEMGDLYQEVQKVIGINSIPQFVFCAGYMARQQKPTPKHSVEEKLIN